VCAFFQQKVSAEVAEQSKGAAGICLHLYDTAPSGRYGTMSYMARGLAMVLNLGDHANMECAIS